MTISAPKVVNLYEILRADAAAYSKLLPIVVADHYLLPEQTDLLGIRAFQ
jgi:hypothetical protein